MTTIAIVSQKGGTGKTTLAIHLAASAERKGEVALVIDADPQATASQWADWREEAPPEVIDSAPPRIAAKIEQAKEAGATFIVIDTPPHADTTASKAMEAADLVLIPCRPSAFDLAAIRTTARLVQLLAKPAGSYSPPGLRTPSASMRTLPSWSADLACPFVRTGSRTGQRSATPALQARPCSSWTRAERQLARSNMFTCGRVNR
jgi:chromosome partitioning protein